MSYNEDVVISKLSTLNETQDSIVNVSQWIMFHKRHAQKTADIWARYLKQSPVQKKLSLIYLANEVVQQTRARRKEEFVNAFSEIIVDSVVGAYRQVPQNIKDKIKRVVDVWRQRSIFDNSIIDTLEQRINSGVIPKQGFGLSMVPPALKEVATLQESIDHHSSADQFYQNAVKSFDELFDSDALPAPPVYSKKLGELEKNIEDTLTHHQKSIASRKKMIEELKKMAEKHEQMIVYQEAHSEELNTKLQKVKETKKEVDEMQVGDEVEGVEEIEAPEVESFTPPATEPEPPKEPKESMESEPQSAQVEEYAPEDDTNDAAPAYDPNSSDEEEEGEGEEPASKKQKTDGNETVQQIDSSQVNLEGLNPEVAKLLASLQKK